MCRIALGIILSVLLPASLSFAQTNAYIIDTVAGHYPLGDGGPATEALLEFPQGAAMDAAGNLFIADRDNSRIRKVAPDGTISTVVDDVVANDVTVDPLGNLYLAVSDQVFKATPQGDLTVIAGTGRSGYTGDGGPATEARFRWIAGVAISPDGSIYVVDETSHVVRRIGPDGIISTIAGTGTQGYSGDGGPGTAAQLSSPLGVAVDAAGNVCIADRNNRRVRRVAPDGIITTVAGNGSGGTPVDGAVATDSPLGLPGDVAADAAGGVYIADVQRHRVYEVSSDGTIRTIAGTGESGFSGDGGPGAAARLDQPGKVNLDGAGNLYITDSNNHRIRRVSPGGLIETVAGSSHHSGDAGPATQALLSYPDDVAVDNQGNIYIADTMNHRIRKVTPDGRISTYAGTGEKGSSGNGGPATSARMFRPGTVAVDSLGNLYIGESRQVRRVSPNGTIEAVAGTGGYADEGDEGPATEARFNSVAAVAIGGDGSLYIADSNSNRVRRVTPDGVIHAFAGTGTGGFSGDGSRATTAELSRPEVLAIGADGTVFISDTSNRRVRSVLPDGTITTVVGNGECCAPVDGQPATASRFARGYGLAVDGMGDLYVSDYDRVYRVDSGGFIYRIAGGDSAGFSGDGGLAIGARLNTPQGLALTASGRLLIADRSNHRIRRLTPDQPASLEIRDGNNQTGLVGQALPDLLAVRVFGTTGAAAGGVEVLFQVTSGQAVLTTASATTDVAGIAGSGLTLGDTPGDVTVTVAVTGLSPVAFQARAVRDPAGINMPPVVSQGGVVGAGLSVPPVTEVSPGGIVSIFGSAFAAAGTFLQVGPGDLVNGRLPASLGGVCVQIGSEPAYMLHVLAGQLNVQVPQVPVDAEAAVQVIRNCGRPEQVSSTVETVTARAAAPEFFYWIQNANGRNPIAAVNPVTGQYIGAPGLMAGLTFVAAKAGDLVDMYATGFGATSPAIAPGEIPDQLAQTVMPAQVTIGGVDLAAVDILYSGVTQWAGVYLLRIRMPSLAAGEPQVTVRIGSATSPAGGYLTVAE